MLVYGLSGKSGTGKSYRATELCGRMHIDALIDDGIFVHGNSIIEGQSAKKQPTRLGAVKTALFTDDTHRDKVSAAIKRTSPRSVLIIGTSDEMVNLIAERLEIPKPEQIIHIEDITTKEERELARSTRNKSGTHIIPAPTFQVKKQFSGYFLNPKRSFKANDAGKNAQEKTIVRPTYSYLGEFSISDRVITDIVLHLAEENPGVASVLFVASQNEDAGMYIRIITIMNYGYRLRDCAEKLQAEAIEAITQMTAFNVLGVEVEIRGLKFRQI